MLTPKQKQALAIAARAARGAELETGCPAAISLAQWAVESGWGIHQPGNNPFGIKAVPGQKFQLLATREVMHGESITIMQKFAVYDSLQQAFEEHGKLLTTGVPYREAFERFQWDGDLDGFIDAIAAKYATDPNYAHSLTAILAMPEVQQALVIT